MFSKKEIIHLVISIIFLGLIFGFDDGAKNFVLGHWLVNLLGITLIVAISILIKESVMKLVSLSKSLESEYEIWNMHRVWFGSYGKLKKGIPAGIILAILFTFMSKGKFFFAAIGVHNFKEKLGARTGRSKIFIEYFEEATIALSGVMTHVFLVIFAVILSKFIARDLTNLVRINFSLALFSLLPFSDLDGAKIFFGSKILYIFSIIFVTISFMFLKFGLLLGVIVAFIVAFLVMLTYYLMYEQ